MKHVLAALLAFLALTTSVNAQTFPSDLGAPVIDDAEMLPPEVEARLNAALTANQTATGADVRVVTLISMALYAGGEEIDTYAGLLADTLGMADVADGKSALLLIFRDDNELRIETGPAYAATINAEQIIDTVLVPAFREDRFADGVEAGVAAILAGTVPVVVAPEPVAAAPVATTDQPAEGGGSGLWWILGIIAVPVLGIVAMMRRSAARLAATPCPACGKTGLRQERVTLAEATEKAEGRGETRTTCPDCSHSTAVPFSIPRAERTETEKAAPATKAGAKATDKDQGGGASGRW